MTKYPAGVERMDDYIGCVVRLVRDLRLRSGTTLKAGSLYVVTGHHRGRLNLHHHEHEAILACRGADRRHVAIVSRHKEDRTP